MRSSLILCTGTVNTKYSDKSLRRRRLPGKACDICMMVRGKPAEMLAVLVVLTLVPTWSDGLLLKKCELKSKLEAAFSALQTENAEDIIAKLTCTVEHISGFNTNLETITDQTPLYGHDEEYPSGMGEVPTATNGEVEDYAGPEIVAMTAEPLSTQYEAEFIQDDGQVRKRREAASVGEVGGSWMSGDGSGEGSEETQENKGLEETTVGDILQAVKPTDNPLDEPLDTTGLPETKIRSKRSSEDQTICYGIFQLSETACNSESSQSVNHCGLDCSALTDDDITDDIACLMTLDQKVTPMTFTQECLSVEPSSYFAECD